MATWTTEELERLDAAEELTIAPLLDGATPAPATTIWVVRVGDDVYVRSYRGRGGRWFRRALERHQGRIRAGGVERDVTFEESTDDALQRQIDDAYRHKYARYPSYVEPMVTPAATATTLRLTPR